MLTAKVTAVCDRPLQGGNFTTLCDRIWPHHGHFECSLAAVTTGFDDIRATAFRSPVAAADPARPSIGHLKAIDFYILC